MRDDRTIVEPRRRERPLARWMKRTAWTLAAAYGALVIALNSCSSTPLVIDPLERRSGAPVVDDDLELAQKHAPWIYHAIDPDGGRQDVPAPVDFDGNASGDDNWESFPRCELVPTVYYAHLETETHHFLTYHLFHPRDWEPLELGIHLTHEGDGENLQVVVEKASGDVVLLVTQAHYCAAAHALEGAGFRDGRESIEGALVTVDADGVPSERADHVAVFVEARGHGIYAVGTDDARAEVERDAIRVRGPGLVLRPARPGERVAEPALDSTSSVPYQLESTAAKLWPGVRSGASIGAGRLFDGVIDYQDERVSIALPKFHRGDRFSGPFGASRGISPFALDFGWREGTLGALFFDPASRLASELSISGPWSRRYVDHPFATR